MNDSSGQPHLLTEGPEPQMTIGSWGQPIIYVPHDPPAYPEAVRAALPRTNRMALLVPVFGIGSLLLLTLMLWLLFR